MEPTGNLSRQIRAAWDDLRRPIWMFDPVGLRGVYANRAALALWGAESLQELLARDFTAISVAVRARTERLAKATADGTEVSERWTFYPNGQPMTVQATISTYVLECGASVLLFEASPVDAEPEERRALEALRHTSTLISLFGDDGLPLFANPAVFSAYGRSDMPFESRFQSLTDGRELMARALGGEAVGALCKVITSHGERWHHLDAHPGLDPVTGATTVLLNERDVTDTVEAQAALAAAEHKAAEAEARQIFLTEMSHELRTPLNAVLGFSELLSSSGLNPVQAEQADSIQQGGRRLLSVVNEMIRVSEGAEPLDTRITLPDAAGPVPSDRAPRILYIDDSEANRRLVVTVLQSQGLDCETADDGQQGVDAVIQGDWDVILMDIQMPVMDGVAATRAIRGLQDFRSQAPIVAVTANTLAAQLETYAEAGMNDWIAKPVDIGLLVQKTLGWATCGWREVACDRASTDEIAQASIWA